MQISEKLLINAKKLKFPPAFEQEYVDHYNKTTAHYAKIYLPIGLLFSLTLILLDSFTIKNHAAFILQIRSVPVILIVIAYILVLNDQFHKHSQLYISSIILSINAGLNTIIALSKPFEIAYHYYFIGIFLLISVTYCMIRLRFFAANFAVFLILSSYILVVFLFQYKTASAEQFFIIKIFIFILISFSLLCITTSYFLEYFSRRDFLLQKLVEKEKHLSEKLISSIFPRYVADKLKAGDTKIADSYENVTILFADIVGFTQLSKNLPAQDLVNLLDHVFFEFDCLAEKHDLEKIKTIGDAYMVSSKVEITNPEISSEQVLHMALDMLKAINHLNKRFSLTLNIRIGIHSGPVVAGVIGRKKLAFDMWGNTVNTAYQIESSGAKGKIQVSEATYTFLKKKFHFKECEILLVKGLGKIRVYVLENDELKK